MRLKTTELNLQYWSAFITGIESCLVHLSYQMSAFIASNYCKQCYQNAFSFHNGHHKEVKWPFLVSSQRTEPCSQSLIIQKTPSFLLVFSISISTYVSLAVQKYRALFFSLHSNEPIPISLLSRYYYLTVVLSDFISFHTFRSAFTTKR